MQLEIDGFGRVLLVFLIAGCRLFCFCFEILLQAQDERLFAMLGITEEVASRSS